MDEIIAGIGTYTRLCNRLGGQAPQVWNAHLRFGSPAGGPCSLFCRGPQQGQFCRRMRGPPGTGERGGGAVQRREEEQLDVAHGFATAGCYLAHSDDDSESPAQHPDGTRHHDSSAVERPSGRLPLAAPWSVS